MQRIGAEFRVILRTGRDGGPSVPETRNKGGTMTKESKPPATGTGSGYRFAVHPAEGIHRPVLSIVDSGTARIWPEDIDAIFADLRAQGVNLEKHWVIYSNTPGKWDELEIDAHGAFAGSVMLDSPSEAHAIAKLRADWQEEWNAMRADAERLEAEPREARRRRSGGSDDDGYPDDVEIVAMTIRHGADYTKRTLDSLARLEACEDDDARRLRVLASDLRSEPQAEVLPFAPREPKP
jgi:hypothetical protein